MTAPKLDLNRLLDNKRCPYEISKNVEKELLAFAKQKGYNIHYTRTPKTIAHPSFLKRGININFTTQAGHTISSSSSGEPDYSLKDYFKQLRTQVYWAIFQDHKIRINKPLDDLWKRLKKKEKIK